MENKALGKGLSALIPEKIDIQDNASIAYLDVNIIKENRFQPRANVDDANLEDLKASIKERGVLQPILVRERGGAFELIAGERRLKATRALEIEKIPAMIKDVSDQEALVIALVENIQREELNPIEEAQAYQKLIEEFEYSHDDVARSVGKDRSTISNFLRLLKLSTDMQKSICEGELSVGHARTLLGIESPTEQKRLFLLVVKRGLSVRELENLVKIKTKGGARREKSKTTKHQDIIALEEVLQKALGTKVRVDAQKKRGKIIIEYYSSEDLERILKLIKKAVTT